VDGDVGNHRLLVSQLLGSRRTVGSRSRWLWIWSLRIVRTVIIQVPWGCNVPHNPDIRNITYEPASPLIHCHRLLCHYRQLFRSDAATAAAVSIVCRRHYRYHRCPLCHCRRPCRSMPLPPLPSLSFATVVSIAAAAITVFAAAASSRSASDRRPHPVNPFRQWTHYPKAPRL
jgi:hypothetical protein